MCSSSELNAILNEFVNGTKKIFGERLVNVILFGSYARGDYDAESDVDVAILANILKEEERLFTDDIISILSEVDKKHNYALLLSPIVLSYSFFLEWQDTIPFYMTVKNEGVELIA